MATPKNPRMNNFVFNLYLGVIQTVRTVRKTASYSPNQHEIICIHVYMPTRCLHCWHLGAIHQHNGYISLYIFAFNYLTRVSYAVTLSAAIGVLMSVILLQLMNVCTPMYLTPEKPRWGCDMSWHNCYTAWHTLISWPMNLSMTFLL